MLGNGFLWQVVLKFTRVHHPKVPSPYRSQTLGKHLIVGASGQLGIELMLGLQQRYGADAVLLSDVRPSPHPEAAKSTFIAADATDLDAQRAILEAHDVEVVYNLVAMLSAKGEAKPLAAWGLNMNPLLHTLELAREGLVKRVFWPSSIAVFGSDAPKDGTPKTQRSCPPQSTACPKRPENCGANTTTTSLGWTFKHPLPRLDCPIHARRGNDGLCSGRLPLCPSRQPLTCYLDENERLPMMSMHDAVRGAMELMEAPSNHPHSDLLQPQWVRFHPWN